jgi:hypothetical protein
MKTAWLFAYAKDLYLGHASKNKSIAFEYIEALTGGDIALQNFVERYSDPFAEHTESETKFLLEAAERVAREGLDFTKKGCA